MTEPTYRAVVCEELGPPGRLQLRRLPRVPLGAGTVRVALKAAGVNFPDVLMIQGLYQHRPPLPFVPGAEAAGVVAEVAAGVVGIDVGQKVIARMRTGGYAEEAVVPASQIMPLPEGFSFAEGATFLVAHTTAYHGLKTRAAIAPGQTLLVLGAAGGVGLAAVQMGKVLGARVLAAASSQEKLEAAVRHGADATIDYSRERVEDGVKRLTSGEGADVVLDPVGIAQDAALRCVAPEGKLLIAGFAGGTIPAYAANRILLKGCTVIGVRTGESGRRDPAMRALELEALLALAAQGLVRPFVSARFPLQGHAAAMRRLQDRQAIGRIALAYRTDIVWDDEWPSLLFQERDRPDKPYLHRGRLYIPASSMYVHLVSLTKGAMRMVMVSQLGPDDRMRGLITTLSKQRAVLMPVSAPIVYIKRDDFGGVALGEIATSDAGHREYRQLLDETVEQGYARLIGR